MSSEKTILSRLELLASSLGNLLFRNNVGTAYRGKVIKLPNGNILIENPVPISYGLCEGSGDLIGGTKIKITPDMVGRTFLIFTSYEVKTKNTKTTQQQIRFADAITKMGGIAIIDRFNGSTEKNISEENTYVESIRKFQGVS